MTFKKWKFLIFILINNFRVFVSKKIKIKLINSIFVIKKIISILYKILLIYITLINFENINNYRFLFRYNNISNLKKKKKINFNLSF